MNDNPCQHDVLSTGLVMPSWNQNSTSSGIDQLVVNKFIIDTRIRFWIYTRRTFRLQKTHQWRANPKKSKRPNNVRSCKIENIWPCFWPYYWDYSSSCMTLRILVSCLEHKWLFDPSKCNSSSQTIKVWYHLHVVLFCFCIEFKK